MIMMKLSESPIIHFFRGIALLATLILVPGIAIFWNHLPKDIVRKPHSESATPKSEESQFFRKDSSEAAPSFSAFTSESMYPPFPETPIEPAVSLPNAKAASEMSVQQVSWERSQSQLPLPLTQSPQNFELLEQHLKSLGATYYRLEKWGNRGELFRFSCFVTPSESHSYEKHFQAIGADAMTVMRSVIAEIEMWKNGK